MLTAMCLAAVLAADAGALTPENVPGLTLTLSAPAEVSTGQPTKATVTFASSRPLRHMRRCMQPFAGHHGRPAQRGRSQFPVSRDAQGRRQRTNAHDHLRSE